MNSLLAQHFPEIRFAVDYSVTIRRFTLSTKNSRFAVRKLASTQKSETRHTMFGRVNSPHTPRRVLKIREDPASSKLLEPGYRALANVSIPEHFPARYRN